MTTRPLPSGTTNMSVNVPKPLRHAIGRLAYVRGKYTGELLRELMADALARAVAAGEVSKELGGAALEALGKGKGKTFILVLVGFLSLAGGVPRSARHSARLRPSIVRTVRASRKIGETGVYV